MKTLKIPALVLFFVLPLFGQAQNALSNRSYFHEKIDETQKSIISLSGISGALNTAATLKIDSLQAAIEADSALANNDKILYLRGFNDALVEYYNGCKEYSDKVVILPALIDAFGHCMQKQMANLSIEEIIRFNTYDIDKILTDNFSFQKNPGLLVCQGILLFKYCKLHPDRILQALTEHPGLPGADSLIMILARHDPETIYIHASANDTFAHAIHATNDPLVKIICSMAKMATGRQFFPFLDEIYHGKLTFAQIDTAINDSARYYSLMVRTALDYADRIRLKDTPMAMDDLLGRMSFKAKEVYINVINELHEAPDEVRFKIIDKLSPEELYYLPILTEEEIYTSSYVRGVYPKIFHKLTKSDSLLMQVKFDHFKKWIK